MSRTARLISRLGVEVLAGLCVFQSSVLVAESIDPDEPIGATTATANSVGMATFTAPHLQPSMGLEIFHGTEKQARRSPALADFLDAHGKDWEIRWDHASDRPHLLQGPGIPLLPKDGTLAQEATGQQAPTLTEVEALARQFLWQVKDLLRVDPENLVLDPEHSRQTGRQGHLWLLEFQQVYEGLPIEGARVFLRIGHGNIVQFGTERIADVALDPQPTIPAAETMARAMRSPALAADMSWSEASFETVSRHLKILPAAAAGGYDHLLVWELDVVHPADGRRYRWRLDAHTGDLLEVADVTTFGQVTGSVHRVLAPQPVPTPLPRLWVDHQGLRLTDAAGTFDYFGGEASASLAGDLIVVEDDCGPSQLTGWGEHLDFAGSTGTDCATPADGGPGNTQAARDAFFHLTTGYQSLIQRYPSRPWPQPLIARTNLPNLNCQASWDAVQGTFSFSQSNEECANIGEVPGILLHEVGHAGDTVLGGTAVDGGSGEAQADVFAMLSTGDTCIGRGLRPGIPCLNCTACDGARDLGAFALGSGAPIARPANLDAADGLHCDRFTCPYPGGSMQQGPLGFQAHCESQIASSAMFDLLRQLSQVRGDVAGRIMFEDLWFSSLPSLGQAYRRVDPEQVCQARAGAADGCAASNWYSVILAADDDDGNLANGTPNGCHIWQAFDAHGIACGSQPACYCKDLGGLGGSLADAGPDVAICRGDYALLGNPNSTAKWFLWSPGGQTTRQIFVSPDHTTEYTLTAESACGPSQDTVTVEVMECDGFTEDFEDGAPGWTTSGDWHAVDQTPCASPSASSGSGAMYFGLDDHCRVDPDDTRPRDLISPVILIPDEPQSLTFDYFLASQLETQRLGRAEVAVQIEGHLSWEPRWAVEIDDLTGDSWQTSPEISLRPYQGEAIRLRFRFETYAPPSGSNKYLGWLVDNVRIGIGRKLDVRNAPIVSLIEAPTGPISECECVRCRFLAVDEEGRDLSELLAWSSNLDGDIATGSNSALILSPGDHQLTARVTDYEGLSASLSIEVEVVESPTECGPDGWPPAEPRLHCKDDEAD